MTTEPAEPNGESPTATRECRQRVRSALPVVFVVALAVLTTGFLVAGGPVPDQDDAAERAAEGTPGAEADRQDGAGKGDGPTSAPFATLRSAGAETDATDGTGDSDGASAAQPPRGIVGPNESGVNDTDGDGITDAAERDIYGTDPTDPDTDGDGYADGMEVACSGSLPGADPRHHDVFVEVDTVRGTHLDPAAVGRLRAAFADAPVDNPDGESGIALHVRRSDTDLPVNGSVDSSPRPGDHNDLRDYRDRYVDHGDAGYYYVLVTTEAAFRGDDYYAGSGVNGAAVVESFDSPKITSSLLMHELGHAFGLGPGEVGVDEERFETAEYRSVMNYNALYEVETYSDGSGEVGRDEWSFVAEDRYRPPVECEDDDGTGGACAAACVAGQ
ncbi:hypothetical protein SAMN05216559_0287 [Halomicrobium zhouii]|uniref:Thrombospondin type 3 repeat-containing protein n=1 Tax=Halomicrobium zhouii TaxID=767519 RepID=A0A1I6K6T8_9EURY|nr:hypothetical protein [Halomicrobium zhouii]SFR86953.1 hypothetical protein SAMN05216559_0287 [Halomicrobium zhouii]